MTETISPQRNPSLPGYGFSGKPTARGWNPAGIAKAWATPMQRLGYTKCVAQGGDWGNAVSELMALPPADVVRNRRFSGRPCGLDARP
jgi:hypothetical protein